MSLLTYHGAFAGSNGSSNQIVLTHLQRSQTEKICDQFGIIDDKPAITPNVTPVAAQSGGNKTSTRLASHLAVIVDTSAVELEEAQLAEAQMETAERMWVKICGLPARDRLRNAIISHQHNFRLLVQAPQSITLDGNKPLDGGSPFVLSSIAADSQKERVVAATCDGRPCVAKIYGKGRIGDFLIDVLLPLNAVRRHLSPSDTTEVLGISQTDSHWYVLYESANLDLRKYLEQCRQPIIHSAHVLTLRLVSLVARLQASLGYVGDIKLSNFLVHYPLITGSHIRLSIADGGCPFNALRRVTRAFAPPEYFTAVATGTLPADNITFGRRFDVYSLGHVVLATLLRLISGASFEFVRFITETPAVDLIPGGDANNPFCCKVKNDVLTLLLSDSIIKILKGCFEPDPEKRLTVSQLEQNLRSIDWYCPSMTFYVSSYYNRRSFTQAIVEHHYRNVAKEMKNCNIRGNAPREIAALEQKKKLEELYCLL